ncbi:MAG: type VI secretion system baseplate subunit TssE [Terriglobia bacterium]|jgi:type VI secretion system protein ImpF
MPTTEREGPVTLSVLDRLIDQEPERKLEPPLTRAQSLRELKAALRRDLEWLLNTRRTIEESPASLKELEHSLYNYGLPDVSSLYLRSSNDQDSLLKAIRVAINFFEPRLLNIKVTLEPAADDTRVIRFGIEGLLRMDPAPEHVFFDTMLEPMSGQYQVKGS